MEEGEPVRPTLWFVDVRYVWRDITHTDRYAVAATSAEEAKTIASREVEGAHVGWMTAQAPPKRTMKAYGIGDISLVGEGL